MVLAMTTRRTNLGTELRRLRRGREIEQTQVADFLGVTVQSVSNWERGIHPRAGPLALMLSLYEATPEQRQAVMDAAKLDAE